MYYPILSVELIIIPLSNDLCQWLYLDIVYHVTFHGGFIEHFFSMSYLNGSKIQFSSQISLIQDFWGHTTLKKQTATNRILDFIFSSEWRVLS